MEALTSSPAVCNGTMADRANDDQSVLDRVEDPVVPNPRRPQPAQPANELFTGPLRFGSNPIDGLKHRVPDRPGERLQIS